MSVAVSFSCTDLCRTRAIAGRWEVLAASLCLAQFSEPLFAAIAQSQGLDEPPGAARLAFLPVAGFLAWALLRDARAAGRAALAAPLLLGLLGLALISTLWSIDGGASLRRAVWLGFTMGFGLYLAWRYDWPRLLEVLAGAFVLLAAGSALVALAAPHIGVMPAEHPGAWAGLYTHKNTLGGLMALGAPAALAAAIANPARRRAWLAGAGVCVAVMLMSTSKTALLTTLIGFSTIAAGALMRRGPMFAIVIGFGAAMLGVLAGGVLLLAPDALADLIGRDLTLTGRTDIWAASERAVEARPWLGYGYYAFWLDENGPAFWVRQAVNWQVQSAHNGWLETALGLGRIGVALAALQLIATLTRGARAILDPVAGQGAGLWAPGFLLAFALYSLSESHILQANNLFWAVYVAAAAKLALDARDRRAPPRGGAVSPELVEGLTEGEAARRRAAAPSVAHYVRATSPLRGRTESSP